MNLVRLIYSSRKAEGVEVPDLLRLLDEGTENNKRNGITGLLCFTDNMFLAALEGDALSVNQLYRKIIVDKRQTELTLIDYSSCPERAFSDWAMGFVDLDAISTKELDMSALPDIKELDPVSALWLLKEISKTLCR